MNHLLNILDHKWWRFEWRYFRGQTPWDTNITPPEVMAFLKDTTPGCALDLGCGTGTNAITLRQHGWQVTGIDFSYKAIRAARRKAARKDVAIDFRVGDAADLDDLTGPFDYALDIGCLFTLGISSRKKYAKGLSRLMKPGSTYMLYAWMSRPGPSAFKGITPDDVDALFEPVFERTRSVIGEERAHKTAWHWLTKK
jgi:SAM-dependent methyltransferase